MDIQWLVTTTMLAFGTYADIKTSMHRPELNPMYGRTFQRRDIPLRVAIPTAGITLQHLAWKKRKPKWVKTMNLVVATTTIAAAERNRKLGKGR